MLIIWRNWYFYRILTNKKVKYPKTRAILCFKVGTPRDWKLRMKSQNFSTKYSLFVAILPKLVKFQGSEKSVKAYGFSEWTSVLLPADFKTLDLFSGEIPANFNILCCFHRMSPKPADYWIRVMKCCVFFCHADLLNYYPFRLCCSLGCMSEVKEAGEK